MSRIAGPTHAALRIMSGLLFFCPGALILFGWFGGMPAGSPATALTTIGGILEIGCGLLIAVGLFTRWAAFVASGEMAVAYFLYHAPSGFWPIQNQGVPAILFCFIFLFLWGNGPGPFSLDGQIQRRKAGGRGTPS